MMVLVFARLRKPHWPFLLWFKSEPTSTAATVALKLFNPERSKAAWPLEIALFDVTWDSETNTLTLGLVTVSVPGPVIELLVQLPLPTVSLEGPRSVAVPATRPPLAKPLVSPTIVKFDWRSVVKKLLG